MSVVPLCASESASALSPSASSALLTPRSAVRRFFSSGSPEAKRSAWRAAGGVSIPLIITARSLSGNTLYCEMLPVAGNGGGGGVMDADIAVGVVLFGGHRPLLHELKQSEEGDDDLKALFRTFGEFIERKSHRVL